MVDGTYGHEDDIEQSARIRGFLDARYYREQRDDAEYVRRACQFYERGRSGRRLIAYRRGVEQALAAPAHVDATS